MAIFDIEKDDLRGLSGALLEEFVARLAEAEVAAHGHSPARVSWSGPADAPDDGIDIHVRVPAPELDTGFLARPDTVFQCKKGAMPPSGIRAEMLRDGRPREAISRQAEIGGGYVIASLDDDCSPPMRKARLGAMREAAASDPNNGSIHLDFFDRSRLALWLRQHPSVQAWAKGKLGRGHPGWRPHGAWSNPPEGSDDTLISSLPGVSVHVPTERGQGLSIRDAIGPMRDLVRDSSKAVRVTGLSGVGKTRIVQALFDEAVETKGTAPLDRTIAIYADAGQGPDPSATAMLDRLIAEGRRAVMILDNCPSDLHSQLAERVSAGSGGVSLITVEYDIRDDKPQATEVVHVEADGPGVAEALVSRRFPAIGPANARRVAEFADGNARLALAIAERAGEGESLALLSDAELFDRLFQQRKGHDAGLRERAEALALVYSFSVSFDAGAGRSELAIQKSIFGRVKALILRVARNLTEVMSSRRSFPGPDPGGGRNELEVLGSISGHTGAQLFRAAGTLAERHLVQERSHWRAILPHAVADGLARSALYNIPAETLRSTFEAPGNGRLLMSFAHRLGFMHDHQVAKEIVEAWLHPDGLLGRVPDLDENKLRMLEHVAPVAPDALLDRIEAEVDALVFRGPKPPHGVPWGTILGLLQSLAYEAGAFDRCARLLLRIADRENESDDFGSVGDRISGFFQPCLSGTHASLEQRLAIVEECLRPGGEGRRRSLGIRLLSTALDGPRWTSFGHRGFGARPRDHGFQPSDDELVEWRRAFVGLAARLANSGDRDLAGRARRALADRLQGLWDHEAMREMLSGAAKEINDREHWGEGWKAVRAIILIDRARPGNEPGPEPLPRRLADLERELRPRGLLDEIKTYVLGEGRDDWALDPGFDDGGRDGSQEERVSATSARLGEDFAESGRPLDDLGPELFSSGGSRYRESFGRGLARGAGDLRAGWDGLIDHLKRSPASSHDFCAVGGFIEEAASIDPRLARELLDECASHPELRRVLVGLHPPGDFTEADLDRCMALLDGEDANPGMYGPILWHDGYAHLPPQRLAELAERLLAKPGGGDVLLDALGMRFRGKCPARDAPGPELRELGLRAATRSLRADRDDPGGIKGRNMKNVVGAVLGLDGNEAEKSRWMDAVFSVVDERPGYAHLFEQAIETAAGLMPAAFLDRVFRGDEEQRRRRATFLRHGGTRRRPLLGKADVGDLVDWCRRRGEADAWGVVASGIGVWERSGGGGTTIKASAIRFLEAAPEPGKVLDAYADRVAPLLYSAGSRSAIMQSRADAIKALAGHGRDDIAKAAKSALERLTREIEQARAQDEKRDKEREQRFE